jgi:hypothetical protein
MATTGNFLILSVCNSSLALQGGNNPGDTPTLQAANSSNPLQLWDVVLQRFGDFYGFAVVNDSNDMSIASNGEGQNLVMQPFAYGETDYSATWNVVNFPNSQVRFAYPPDNSWTFNDRGGACQPNDTIMLNNDAAVNSLWTLNVVPVAQSAALAQRRKKRRGG